MWEQSPGVNIEGFTEEQKAALLDLLLLGMYADGHVAAAEDDRVKRMLDLFTFESDYARQQFGDAAFGRVNRREPSGESLRFIVSDLSAKFNSQEQRRQALEALAELLASDNRVTREENQFLILVEEALELKK